MVQKFRKFYPAGNQKFSFEAFTLIELLIVIAIIGLIASIIAVAILGAKAQARDAERQAELDQIRKGLAFYYIDKGEYPTTTDWISLENEANPETQAFIQKMKPNYLSEIPRDPLYPQEYETGKKYSYQYQATTTKSYELYAKREGGGFFKISSEIDSVVQLTEGPSPWVLTESNCNALDGWYWYVIDDKPACWSKTLGRASWNEGVGDDTDNPGIYACAPEPSSLKSRMEAVSNGEWYKIVSNVNGIDITSVDNGSNGWSKISALAIADCVDGERDLCSIDGCLGNSWSSINLSLRNWAGASGHSALPYCGTDECTTVPANEYTAACAAHSSNDLPLDCYTGRFYGNELICGDGSENDSWIALVGKQDGSMWDIVAHTMGRNNCANQDFNAYTSYDIVSFRVVVRP